MRLLSNIAMQLTKLVVNSFLKTKMEFNSASNPMVEKETLIFIEQAERT